MGLAQWAHAKDPALEMAERKVHSLPLSKTGHGVKVPFPYAARAAYKTDFSNQEINQAIEDAPVKLIRIAGLHAIQHSVKVDRVLEYIKHHELLLKGTRSPLHKGLVDLPIVIQYQGIRFIHDGHHRTTAAWALGEDNVEARYVNLDALVKV
jgi:hypothetical protein